MISSLQTLGHALREHNQEADRLANEAMDRGMGRSSDRVAAGLKSFEAEHGKGAAA